MKKLVTILFLVISIGLFAEGIDLYVNLGLSNPYDEFKKNNNWDKDNGFAKNGIHLSLDMLKEIYIGNVVLSGEIFHNPINTGKIENYFEKSNLGNKVRYDDANWNIFAWSSGLRFNLLHLKKFDLNTTVSFGLARILYPNFEREIENSSDDYYEKTSFESDSADSSFMKLSLDSSFKERFRFGISYYVFDKAKYDVDTDYKIIDQGVEEKLKSSEKQEFLIKNFVFFVSYKFL